ncbi:MAG: MFS transporter [Cellulomonadaceae bacterium]|nr:MFS transporter [Cellulomonadaceae bacterium]
MRYVILALLATGTLVNYLDRINLTVSAPLMQAEFNISDAQWGVLLSAFGWTYALLQVPGGIFLDKVGITWVGRVCSGLWVVATFLTATVSGLLPLFLLRLLLGVAEAPAFPMAAAATSQWFPVRERGLATASFDMTSKLSNAVGVPIMAVIVASHGWRWAFIFTGVLSVGYALWFWILYRSPSRHPRLSATEATHIASGGAQKARDQVETPSPMRYLVRQRKLWAIAFTLAAYNYTFFLFLTWLPTYLVREMGLDVKGSGLYTAIPWLVGTLTAVLIGGVLLDRFIKAGRNPSTVRKVFLTVGLLMGTAVAGAMTATTAAGAVAWIAVSLGGVCIASSVIWSLPGLIAPPGAVGRVGSLMAFIGNLSSIAAPLVTGFVVEATGSFAWAFGIAGGVVALGLFSALVLLGPIEQIKPAPVAAPAAA